MEPRVAQGPGGLADSAKQPPPRPHRLPERAPTLRQENPTGLNRGSKAHGGPSRTRLNLKGPRQGLGCAQRPMRA
eukprot:4777975-Pyramimonas_sp.AAC.3